eukprot:3716172-Pleurochrysis_carterae.AAC.3
MDRDAQSSATSRHVSDWQRWQVTGQWTCMKPGLESHSPIDAHVAHMGWLSTHSLAFFDAAMLAFFTAPEDDLQRPHAARHVVCMYATLDSHSPCSAQ